jgi:hypothetical protein
MKTLTYLKRIEVETTVEFPVITFVAEKKRIFDDGYSYDVMAYVPRFNGLTLSEYCDTMSMKSRVIEKALEQYVMETYNSNHGCGKIYWYCYSAEELGLPELPKLEDRNYNDDHADLVAMFTGK